MQICDYHLQKKVLTSALEIFIFPNLILLPNNYKAITGDWNIFLGRIFTYFDYRIQLLVSLTAEMKNKINLAKTSF